MIEYACKKCKRILKHKKCEYCGKTVGVSKNWKGFVLVFNPDKSIISKELNINSAGRFALRVR